MGMRTEEEILGAAQNMSHLMDIFDEYKEEGKTEEEINAILMFNSAITGSEILTADFYRGMYRSLTWALGTRYNDDLDRGVDVE